MPQFSGHYRQRGNSFRVLDLGIGRVTIPLARKIKVSSEKKLQVQAAPEIKDIATRKKTRSKHEKHCKKHNQKIKLIRKKKDDKNRRRTFFFNCKKKCLDDSRELHQKSLTRIEQIECQSQVVQLKKITLSEEELFNLR